MDGTNKFFFDTYAIFEILKGNKNYEKYKDCEIITTIFNIAELNYNLKKERSKDEADKITKKFLNFIVDVPYVFLIEAMDLKITEKQISIPDAVGYTTAKRNKVKFLTGDIHFKGMDNVEFVK